MCAGGFLRTAVVTVIISRMMSDVATVHVDWAAGACDNSCIAVAVSHGVIVSTYSQSPDVMVAIVSPSPIVISQKLSKIGPWLLWNTIRS